MTKRKPKSKLTRKERQRLVDRMVDNDIDSVHEHDPDRSFLCSILTGDGWVPYNQLSDAQVINEYDNREFPE